ncbi:MAG: flagellar biosynthetic protein FliR [Magnetococcales bacterium]|nr:flagellar biosynthetic protein FliR [Magnetococcales bacterium]
MDPAALLDFLGFSIQEIERMGLIMARLSGLFLSAPFFSRAVGPMRIRVVLIFFLTIIIFPVVPPWKGEGEGVVPAMVFAGFTELLIGAMIGMLVHWVLVSTQVAGGIIGFHMGLSMAMVLDPTSGLQESVLSNLLYLTGLMLFLIMDGHHLLVEGLARSFVSLPLGGGLPPSDHMLQSGVAALSRLFRLSILIAAPVIVATKLLYLGMGLINRASPQIQVFFLAMPLAQMIGFVVVGISMVVFGQVIVREVDAFFSLAFKVVNL